MINLLYITDEIQYASYFWFQGDLQKVLGYPASSLLSPASDLLPSITLSISQSTGLRVYF